MTSFQIVLEIFSNEKVGSAVEFRSFYASTGKIAAILVLIDRRERDRLVVNLLSRFQAKKNDCTQNWICLLLRCFFLKPQMGPFLCWLGVCLVYAWQFECH